MLKQAGLALVAAVVFTTLAARAADTSATAPASQPTTASATAPAATEAARSESELREDLQAAMESAQSVLRDPRSLVDAATREKIAPQAIPALQKVVGVLNQIGQLGPKQAEAVRGMRYQMLAFLDLLGDAAAAKTLDTLAASKDETEALSAKVSRSLAGWLKAGKDAAAQAKVLDDMQTLAKANPMSDEIAGTLWVMSRLGAADKTLSNRAVDIVGTDLKGKTAEKITARIAQMKEMEAAEAKLKESEGQPLVIAGKTPEGKDFTTGDWKGKVVLVDFWATWCGPCKAELPRVKKMYQQYHAKGFEVLGVSNDQTADELTGFIKEDGEMPWPQLFDAAAAAKGQWNSNTTRFGISGIPVMFLIDRNGVLRSTTARENFEEMIPKLLDEKAGAATAPATGPATQPAK